VVGLDLDPAHIAAAEVSVNGHISVRRGAVAELRPGILRDGEVTDPVSLSEALKAFFEEHDLPRNVRLGVANQRIVVRSLDLPPLEDPKALAAAVKAEAPDHIPMPMDEAILDFVPLGQVQTVAWGVPGDVPIPADYEGAFPDTFYEEAALRADPPRREGAEAMPQATAAAAPEMDAEDDAVIYDRLKSLGYIE